MEISEASSDTWDEGYIHQFQPEPIKEFTSSRRRTEFKDILPGNISQMAPHSHKLCDETGQHVVNLMESQWKLRQQHDQSIPMEGKPLKNNTVAKRKKEI